MNPLLTLVTYFALLQENDYEILCTVTVPLPWGTDHKYVQVTQVETNAAKNIAFVHIYDEDLKTTGMISIRERELDERIVILDPDSDTIELDCLEHHISDLEKPQHDPDFEYQIQSTYTQVEHTPTMLDYQ